MSKQPRMPLTLQHRKGDIARATLYYLSIACAVINAAVLMLVSTNPEGLVPWMLGYCSLAVIVSIWGIMIAKGTK